MKERKQLNLRLDNEGELLEEIKEAARSQDISLNQFVINALRSALGIPVQPRYSQDEVNQRFNEDLLALKNTLWLVEKRIDNLDKLLDRVDAIEEAIKQQAGMENERYTANKLDTELDTRLDSSAASTATEPVTVDEPENTSESDRDLGPNSEQLPLDSKLDKVLDSTPISTQVFTDAQVANDWECLTSYIRDIRLGKREPDPADRDIWEYWQPVKGKAKWRKIKPTPRVLPK